MKSVGWTVLRWVVFFPLACLAYLAVATTLAYLIGTLLGSGDDFGQQLFSLMGTGLSAFAATLTASRIAPRWPVRVGLGTALVLALLVLGLNALIYYADEAKTIEYAPAVSTCLGGLVALLIVRRWRRESHTTGVLRGLRCRPGQARMVRRLKCVWARTSHSLLPPFATRPAPSPC